MAVVGSKDWVADYALRVAGCGVRKAASCRVGERFPQKGEHGAGPVQSNYFAYMELDMGGDINCGSDYYFWHVNQKPKW